jgi:antitoxin ChpS
MMLAVPPALLESLNLKAGAKVGIAVEKGRLIVKPQRKPRYSLEDLLAQCNPKAARSTKDREWLGGKPTGRELI